jgi:superfamily II DNA or RNA helicase
MCPLSKTIGSAMVYLPSPPLPSITLRPYQEECVQRVLAAYEHDRHGEELVVLPTAAGKTVIFSRVIARLADRYGTNALIIAHTDELLTQAAEKYRQVKPAAIIGRVGGGIYDYSGDVTVASVDTLRRPKHLALLPKMGYGLVVVDEAHRSASPKYQRVLQALTGAFVLKVTATPDRLDGKPISQKPPLYSSHILEMIEQGYLCDVRAIAIRTETSIDNLRTHRGDYREKELERAVDTPERNRRVVEAYIDHALGRRTICFAVTVEHARHLAASFTAARIPAAAVSGETPLAERRRLYQALREGSLKVLSNALVLTEGFDLPQLECVIMARPTESRALFVQCLGRGLRLAPAKRECVVLDLTDNCLRHRLAPQNLSTVLGKDLCDGESVLETVRREEEEEAQQTRPASATPLVRRLADTRTKDLAIDITMRLDWQELTNGVFLLEVGPQKHRILLAPSRSGDGSYAVWAELAPTFIRQRWLADSKLGWAQEHAERQARLLQAGEKKRVLVDRTATWRSLPVDPQSKQAYWLCTFAVPQWETLTRGEASDILDQRFAERDKERKQRRAQNPRRTVKRTRKGKGKGRQSSRYVYESTQTHETIVKKGDAHEKNHPS